MLQGKQLRDGLHLDFFIAQGVMEVYEVCNELIGLNVVALSEKT
jgi:hypothetical protein